MKRLREQVFKLSATDDLDTKTLMEVSSVLNVSFKTMYFLKCSYLYAVYGFVNKS